MQTEDHGQEHAGGETGHVSLWKLNILLKILKLLFDSFVTSGNGVAVKRLGSIILGNKISLYVN